MSRDKFDVRSNVRIWFVERGLRNSSSIIVFICALCYFLLE